MTILINPALGASQKLYSGGSNTCFKAITKGGPTPTQITDTSGRGNHGVFTKAPEPVLVGDLWCYQFVNADSEYVTVPDITELLGATEATWCAWVRKDAYVANQCVVSDYSDATWAHRKWLLGNEATENKWRVYAGDGTSATAVIEIDSVFTTGWHFVWMRFTGGSATGLESGCDDSVGTPATTASVAALGAVAKGLTNIGRHTGTTYSSMTLGALTIWPYAISDAEIQKWRYHVKRQLGL